MLFTFVLSPFHFGTRYRRESTRKWSILVINMFFSFLVDFVDIYSTKAVHGMKWDLPECLFQMSLVNNFLAPLQYTVHEGRPDGNYTNIIEDYSTVVLIFYS